MLRTRVMCLAMLMSGVAACGGGNVFDPVTKQQIVSPRVLNNKVDVLFVVDNSPSMVPKQDRLNDRIQNLLQQITSANPQPYSFHIGVVTTDLGANDFVDPLQQCVPNGKGGRLQRLGDAHDEDCLGVTGPYNFIDYNELALTDGKPMTNLPDGQDLAKTFGCMARVGDIGCGFEQPLEAAYRALKDPPPENDGFLRDDAVLVIAWVTDEDDCSAPPDSDVYDPMPSTPPPDGLGLLNSFRCTKFSIACGTPTTLVPYAASDGPLLDCHDAPAAMNKLYPVQRYVDLFTLPSSQGGLKADPRNVVLFDLSATDDHVQTILGDPATAAPCGGPLGANCQVMLDHSCVSAKDSHVTGDPAVRLRQVVRASAGRSFSICDDDYSTMMSTVGSSIVSKLSGQCLELPLPNPLDPECDVKDVSTNSDGSTSSTPIPRCDQRPGNLPCWHTVRSSICPVICEHDGDAGQNYSVQIDRSPKATPTEMPSISCKVLTAVLSADGNYPTCAPTSTSNH